MPSAADYDGFPQVENGVGAVRVLVDEWARLKAGRLPPGLAPATVVCGTLIAPVLGPILADLNALTGVDLQLVPVVNQFFGPVTTVSGLLTRQDVVAALQGRPLGERVLLPRAMFTGRYGAEAARPGMTLDDWSLDEISARLDRQVTMTGTLEVAGCAASRTRCGGRTRRPIRNEPWPGRQIQETRGNRFMLRSSIASSFATSTVTTAV